MYRSSFSAITFSCLSFATTSHAMDPSLVPFLATGAVSAIIQLRGPAQRYNQLEQENNKYCAQALERIRIEDIITTFRREKEKETAAMLEVFKKGSAEVYGGENLTFSFPKDWDDGSMLEFIIDGVDNERLIAKLCAFYYMPSSQSTPQGGTVLKTMRVELPRIVKNGNKWEPQPLEEYIQELERDKKKFIATTLNEANAYKSQGKDLKLAFLGCKNGEPIMIQRTT